MRFHSQRWLVLVTFVWAALALTAANLAMAAPNVILVMTDDQGYGARTRPWADGGETLTRRGSMGDISPLSAAVLAFGRLGVTEAPKTAEAHAVFL